MLFIAKVKKGYPSGILWIYLLMSLYTTTCIQIRASIQLRFYHLCYIVLSPICKEEGKTSGRGHGSYSQHFDKVNIFKSSI